MCLLDCKRTLNPLKLLYSAEGLTYIKHILKKMKAMIKRNGKFYSQKDIIHW